jgi:hypothetical protein
MDKVQKSNFTDYNAPSSEPFRLVLLFCWAPYYNFVCVCVFVYVYTHILIFIIESDFYSSTLVNVEYSLNCHGFEIRE